MPVEFPGACVPPLIATLPAKLPLPRKVPAGRLGTESEVSAAIVFLLSPAAAFISGSCLRVDGAVPNAKREFAQRGKTAAFDGFHLAAMPKVLS